MYRITKLSTQIAQDSNLNAPLVREMVAYQTLDNESFDVRVRVGPSDSETQVSFGTISNAKFVQVLSDYPVRVRLNGSGATQFTLMPNNVSATNVGAPLPPQCGMLLMGTVSELRLQPISSAAQTANVTVTISGDPTSDYA